MPAAVEDSARFDELSRDTAPLFAPPALILLTVAMIAGNLAYQHGVVDLLADRSRDTALVVGLLTGLLFYLALWFMASIVQRVVHLVPARSDVVTSILLGTLVGAAMVAPGVATVFSSKGRAALDPGAAAIIDDGRLIAIVSGILVLAVAAPLVEEYVFRGLLAQSFVGYSRTMALWISSVAFAAAHLSPVRFPYYLLMGLVLGRLYLRKGIVASVTAHVVVNATILAVAAIVLTTGGSSTVTSGPVQIKLPPGWSAVGARGPATFVAIGPGGATLELVHQPLPPGVTFDEATATQVLATIPDTAPVAMDRTSIRTVVIGMGRAVEAEASGSGETGLIVVAAEEMGVDVFVFHAPNGAAGANDFRKILLDTRRAS